MIGDSRYASGVRSRAARGQLLLVFFLVLAVLFAPAGEERPGSPVRLADDLVGARILAPTVREGIATADPKLSARKLSGPDQRSRLGSIPLIPASVAAVLLLVLLAWLVREEAGAILRRFVLRALIPRGPPHLLAG
jgi:hypothetical protein